MYFVCSFVGLNFNDNYRQIQDFLKPFIGKHVWHSQKGYGSFLTFSLGLPSIEIKDPIQLPNTTYKQRPIAVKGEQYIWIYCCNWRINVHEQELALNESSDRKINKAVIFLDGQAINEIKIDSEKLTMTFTFDLGGQLLIWNNETYEPNTNLINDK